MALAILFIGLVVFAAHLFTAVFERSRIPDVLLLMFVGIVIGPLFGWISVDDFGRFGSVLTTMALVVILFEGGLTLNVSTLGKAVGPTLSLTLLTSLATIIIVAGFCITVLQFSVSAALLLGAILAGTSSAVVVPMVRGIKTGEPASTVLILESALTDVLCIVLTFSLLQARTEESLSGGAISMRILTSLAVATLIGFLASLVWLTVLNRIRRFPNTMFTTLAFIFVLYGGAELLGFSGAISALSFGIMLTNFRNFRLDRIRFLRSEAFAEVTAVERSFFGEIVFLLKTFFFIYLGLSIQFNDPRVYLIALVLIGAIYGVRLLITRILFPRRTFWKDAAMVSIMVPKGLAAAVLATIPLSFGVPEGDQIQGITFAVVFLSILVTAVLVPLIEKTRLGMVYQRLFSTFAATPSSNHEERGPAGDTPSATGTVDRASENRSFS